MFGCLLLFYLSTFLLDNGRNYKWWLIKVETPVEIMFKL
jgi:hypothetical protein